MKVLVSPSYDVYTNLAMEEHLFLKGEEVLFLWVNDPCVVIGYHQNVYREVNLPFLRERRIALARRLTGGGAVYHDRGNLNVSLISPAGKEERFNALLLQALRRYGLKTVETPNNDLTVDGKKFCGQASFEAHGTKLTHACLLVEADLSILERILTPSKLKLQSHAIKSVRSRVANLASFSPSLTVESLIETFSSLPGMKPCFDPTLEEAGKEGEEKFRDPHFLYGQNPPFDLEGEMRIDGDNVLLRLSFEEGVVKDVSWYSDGARNPSYEARLERCKGRSLEELEALGLHFSTDHSRR